MYFISWLEKLFLPAVSQLLSTGPVILFLNRHYSHISLELIRSARRHHVHLLCLPPNTMHILQQLDVGTFSPVKKSWKKILKRWKLETRGQVVSKEAFPTLIFKLWEQALMPAQCTAGFRGAGLKPFSGETCS